MYAYHGSQAIKDTYLARVDAHRAADELIHGTYWEGGKGCAVGCTIHGTNHQRYETELGIPRMLAHLEDSIFEGASQDYAQAWPSRFLQAMTPGQDLSLVGYHFLVWLLTESHFPGFDDPRVSDQIQQCANVIVTRMRDGSRTDIEAAAEAAGAAALAAAEAAWEAAEAAWAARAAAEAAGAAAEAAGAAAEAAEAAAEAVGAAAWEAAEAARAAYECMGDTLLGLLAQAPMALDVSTTTSTPPRMPNATTRALHRIYRSSCEENDRLDFLDWEHADEASAYLARQPGDLEVMAVQVTDQQEGTPCP